VAAGWLVLRFTYRSITTRPKATADRIRAAVDRWAPADPLGWLPPDAA
jgi:very-short-patch-repair endonuclease